MSKAPIKVNIPVIFMKEGDTFVCYTPAFDLAAHGDTFEDAKKSFAISFKLFLEEVTKMGTWPKVLQEYGWKKVGSHLLPPQVIGQTLESVEIPASL